MIILLNAQAILFKTMSAARQRLAPEERAAMDQYLTSIRELELEVQAMSDRGPEAELVGEQALTGPCPVSSRRHAPETLCGRARTPPPSGRW